MRRVAEIRNGSDYKNVEVAEGGYPVYGSGGVFRRASNYLFDGESVLFGRKGTIDRPLHVSGKFWTVDTMFYTRLDPALVHPRFLYFYALTMPFGLYSTNTALPSMTQSQLAGHSIPLPPLLEQQHIADYLDRETAQIDTLIGAQQSLVVLLRERRTSVVAVEFRRDAPRQPLGTVLEHLIDHRGKTPGKLGGTDFSDTGVRVISAVHIKAGRVSWAERERFVPPWMFEKWMPVRLKRGDVLLTSEAPLGGVAQVPDDDPLVLSQRLFALRGRPGILDNSYLRYFLESHRGQDLLRDGASGSTVAGIRQSKLVQIPVPVPPLTEQRRTVSHIQSNLSRIDVLIAEAERFIELSRERRSALITAAVTGQIDVRNEVA